MTSSNFTAVKRKLEDGVDTPVETKMTKQDVESETPSTPAKIPKQEDNKDEIAKYKKILAYKLTDDQLKSNNFPRPSPSGVKGEVKLYGDFHGFNPGTCKRCQKSIDTKFDKKEKCDFHLERSKFYNRRYHPHGCCGRQKGSRGCRSAPSHVHQDNIYTDLAGFRRTEQRPPAVDGHHGVYAIDTESVHTLNGLEICRATVIDMKLNIVYDQKCLPDSDVLDYNTIWSGLTAADFQDVTKTFKQLREDIFSLVSEKTILIGHGLNGDFRGLKMIHDTVVDTTVAYPHERGPPLKKSLKDLASTFLRRSIQTGNGHCSKEDAVASMELILKKVNIKY